MSKCVNCQNDIKDKDKYCRNCGCKIVNNSYYILINIITFIISIALILIIIMFIMSYLVD